MSNELLNEFVEEQKKFWSQLEKKQTKFFKDIETRLSNIENQMGSSETVQQKVEVVHRPRKNPLEKYSTEKKDKMRKTLQKSSNETLEQIIKNWSKYYENKF
eukprot:gene1026-9930_t